MFHHQNQPPSRKNNFLSKLLSVCRNSQVGSSLAIATAMGFIVVGATTVALIEAKDVEVNVISGEQTDQATAAAEAGIANILAFLVDNPELSVYSACVEGYPSDYCSDSTKNSWVNVDQNIVPSASSGSCPNATSGDSLTADEVTDMEKSVSEIISSSDFSTDWQSIGSSNTKYRLVSYDVTNPGDSGEATLVIQGLVDTNDNDVADTGEALVQIEVVFDVSISSGTTQSVEVNGGPPGLWAQDFGAVDNTPIASNVLDSSDCNGGAALSDTTLVTDTSLISPLTGTGTYRKEAVPFPPLPNIPSNIPPQNVITTIPSELPRTGDVATDKTTYSSSSTGDKTYIYKFPNGMNVGNNILTIGRTGQETIIIHSVGDITVNGNGKIQPYQATDVTKVIFHVEGDVTLSGNGSSPNGLSDYQVYVYGQQNITLNGNGDFTGFVFGPESTAKLNGAGNSSDILSGSLWVKRFNPNGNHSIFKQTIVDSDKSNLEVKNETPLSPDYALSNLKGWLRQEISKEISN